LPVRPPGAETTSRLGLRDPVASRVKCGPHGGKNNRMKSWKVSWLSLKTKVEPGQHGSRVMSGDGGGYTEFTGFAAVHQKTTMLLGSPPNRSQRLDEKVRPPRPVQSPRWAALVTEKLQSGGHTSGSQGLRLS
jgi:hypothetical protein